MNILDRIRFHVGDDLDINTDEVKRIAGVLINEISLKLIDIKSLVDFYDKYYYIFKEQKEVMPGGLIYSMQG